MTSSRKVGNRFGYSKKETKENLGGGNKLEELLNKLIDKGWRPRNRDYTKIDEVVKIKIVRGDIQINRGDKNIPEDKRYCAVLYKSKRELVSKESGLWQFCCRNKLVDGKPEWIKTCGGVVREEKQPSNSHYRLIESSLKDDSELEDFLLSNIKVNG